MKYTLITIYILYSQAGVPFRILERDAHISSRGQGWAITLYWVMPTLNSMLPPSIIRKIEAAQVDSSKPGDRAPAFLFLDLSNPETRWHIPVNKRFRINRETMRKVLVEGIENVLEWGDRAVDIRTVEDDGVEVICESGKTVHGRIVVGVDGTASHTRTILLPDSYETKTLPVRAMGTACVLTPDQIAPLRAIDPILFQGYDPESKNYLWFSVLQSPDVREECDGNWKVQFVVSWRYTSPQDDVLPPADRVKDIKQRASRFAPVFRDAIGCIADDAQILEIKLADWEPLPWDNRQGRVTMAGDASHAMTMCNSSPMRSSCQSSDFILAYDIDRGEAANHGILDAANLCKVLKSVYAGEKSLDKAIDEYENEMRARTQTAVVLSRDACIGVHGWENSREKNAVLSERVYPL